MRGAQEGLWGWLMAEALPALRGREGVPARLIVLVTPVLPGPQTTLDPVYLLLLGGPTASGRWDLDEAAREIVGEPWDPPPCPHRAFLRCGPAQIGRWSPSDEHAGFAELDAFAVLARLERDPDGALRTVERDETLLASLELAWALPALVVRHEGRGGELEIAGETYPIEAEGDGRFTVYHTIRGRAARRGHRALLEQLARTQPHRWALERGGR